MLIFAVLILTGGGGNDTAVSLIAARAFMQCHIQVITLVKTSFMSSPPWGWPGGNQMDTDMFTVKLYLRVSGATKVADRTN